MIWYVNIILFLNILLQNTSASPQFDCANLLNLQRHNSEVFKDINVFIKNDESLRNLTTERAIELPVDHFNASDQRKYKMRYFENLKYFKTNGPIILQIGSENEADSSIYSNFAQDLAKDTSGALYRNEQRYYGKSYPLEINDYKDFGNYKYLSARQSLADVASLVEMLKEKPEYKNSKVVAIGGMYGGNLAAWVRQLYPHLVDAAYASSAPVLAKVEYVEFIENVNEDYKFYCDRKDFERIKSMFKRYDEMLKTDAGIKSIKKEHNICDDVDLHIPHNRHRLFYEMVASFEDAAQFGTQILLPTWCPDMIPFYNKTFCLNATIENLIDNMRNKPCSWNYQMCNEFGYFQTLSSKAHIFTHNLPIEFFYDVCKGVFGPEFGEERVKRGVEEVNKLYGGKTPNVTRVIFVSGDMDPWSRLAITHDLSPEAPARLLHGISHLQDIINYDYSDHDIPKNIVKVRNFSKKMIKRWIGL